MSRQSLFAVIAGVALLNGLFSPLVAWVYSLVPMWLPGFVQPSQGAALFASILFLAIATLLVSGIPAALYERITQAPPGGRTALGIWLASAAVLSLPALGTLAAL